MNRHREKMGGSPKRAVCLALTVFFAAALLTGGVKVVSLLREYARGEEVYSDLSGYVTRSGTAELPGGDMIERAGPKVDFAALREINPELVGWLIIEGTGIDYPVVQAENNEYYLTHLFSGEENRAGCIFLNCGNASDFSDRNSVVYGHSLQNGTMFTELLEYKEQSFYEAHPTGLLLTSEKNYEVRFFSGFVSDGEGEAWNVGFPSEGAFCRWLDEAAENSAFTGGQIPTTSDRVLTLSTCSYESSGARFVLMGALKELE